MNLKSIYTSVGKLVFWLSWPFLYIYLRSRKRTRILVIHKSKALVVKPWIGNGKWILPGGGIHKNESSQSAILRELKEETGLQIATRNLNYQGEFASKDNGLKYKYDCFYALYPNLAKLTTQKYEIYEANWEELKNLSKNNSNQDVLKAIRHTAVKV